MHADSRSGSCEETTGKKHLHRGHGEHRGRRVQRRADLKVRTYNRNGECRSFAEVLQAQVAELDFDCGLGAEAFGELLSKINGAVLATGAAEGNH